MSSDAKRRVPPRGGPVDVADEELTTWLHTFWSRETPPDAVVLWQMFSPSRPARGEQIFKKNFKSGERLDAEACAKLCNEIVAAAQNDADATRRDRLFQVEVVDRNRADSVTRLLGPVYPKRLYVKAQGADRDDDDGDGDGGRLAHKYASTMLAQIERDRAQLDKAIGDQLQMQQTMNATLHHFVETLMTRTVELHDKYQQARDQEVERKARAEWLSLKSSLMRDGLRTARNFLTSAVGDDGDGDGGDGGDGDGGDGGKKAARPRAPTAPKFGNSRERMLVDNFLFDCDETKIGEQMFGAWERGPDGAPRVVPGCEGIFSEGQFRLLQGVRSGRLAPDELDKLMPGSGDPLSITDEQVNQAFPLMTGGTSSALMELMQLRRRKRGGGADDDGK